MTYFTSKIYLKSQFLIKVKFGAFSKILSGIITHRRRKRRASGLKPPNIFRHTYGRMHTSQKSYIAPPKLTTFHCLCYFNSNYIQKNLYAQKGGNKLNTLLFNKNPPFHFMLSWTHSIHVLVVVIKLSMLLPSLTYAC